MKSKFMQPFICLLIVVNLAACSLGAKSEPTPDIQATVQAAVDTTLKTEMPAAADSPTPNLQATVDAAVQATAQAGQAIQATVDIAVQATVASMPTPTPVPSVGDPYYYTLSEEELAALIDESIDEAMAANTQASTATTQATSDGSVSDDDVQAVQVYVSLSEQAIANAEALIAAYQDIYGDYASDYMAVLNEIEEDLEAIAQSTAQITDILEQGAQAATQAITQLNDAAQTAQTKTAEMQAQAQGRQDILQSDIQKRVEEILSLKPNEVASDRLGAIQATYHYLDSLKNALNGIKISPQDFQQLAQLGVNASASLKAQGGPQLQRFAGGIDNLNQQMAHGQFPQVKRDVGKFENDFSSLAKRPGRK